MDSILTSIKKNLGITEEYTHFDADLIMHINTIFVALKQMGVGPAEGFYIEDKTATWDEFIEDPVECNAVKTYMTARVRLIFDPPQSSAHIECLKNVASEFEWRLHWDAELSR